MNINNKYLYNPLVDGLFILAPPFVSLLVVLCLPAFYRSGADMPVQAWVILVLCIDVAHVYATLFRTYFDRDTFTSQKQLLLFIPLVCMAVAMMVYSLSDVLFWRLMAYLAVFHFIRQQYGFMRLYAGSQTQNRVEIWIDKIAIYTATVYPMLYWHLHPGRHFNWFVEGDFWQWESPVLSAICLVFYILVWAVYAFKEIRLVVRTGSVNGNKNLVILGTAFSWYMGIVYYNADLVFTLLNVVAHGIPYMALVWVWGRKKAGAGGFSAQVFMRRVFSTSGVLLFASILLLFAFMEEGLWDVWIWHEHGGVFGALSALQFQVPPDLLRLLVPLLALPQIVHYVIDGYIWKIKHDRFNWSKHVIK